jgi:hypothetical protein
VEAEEKKTKSRPERLVQPEPVQPAQEVPEQTVVIHKLKDPHCLTLNSIVDVSLGQPRWSDLVKALMESDFKPKNMYGSAWSFEPGDGLHSHCPKLYNHSMVLHEPHPEENIYSHKARAYARCFKTHWDWSRTTFELPDASIPAIFMEHKVAENGGEASETEEDLGNVDEDGHVDVGELGEDPANNEGGKDEAVGEDRSTAIDSVHC